MWVLYFIIGVLFYFYFYVKTKDALNPFSIFLASWYLAASVSCLYLSPLQERWSLAMHAVVLISGLSFCTFAFIFSIGTQRPIMCRGLNNKATIFLYILFFVALICFIVELFYNDFQFAFFSVFYGLPKNSDIKSVVTGVPVIHYGVVLLPYCAILAFYDILTSNRRKTYNIIVISVALIYSVFWSISRGSVLIVLLGCLYLLNTKKKINVKLIIVVLSALMIVMYLMFAFRVRPGTMSYQIFGSEGTVLKSLASSVYSYIAINFENLRKLVDSSYNCHLTMDYSLKFLYKILGLEEELELAEIQTLFFNARTYIYSFYHDLHMTGIVLFPAIIGIGVAITYKLATMNSYFIIMLAFLQKAIFVPFFGNYFFGEFVLFWPYLVCILYILLAQNMKIQLQKPVILKIHRKRSV